MRLKAYFNINTVCIFVEAYTNISRWKRSKGASYLDVYLKSNTICACVLMLYNCIYMIVRFVCVGISFTIIFKSFWVCICMMKVWWCWWVNISEHWWQLPATTPIVNTSLVHKIHQQLHGRNWQQNTSIWHILFGKYVIRLQSMLLNKTRLCDSVIRV